MSGRRAAPAAAEEAGATITFNGRKLPARPGEPLAATLLANGVRTVASGIYTDRPRGVFGLGAEEPCAYVRVDSPPGESMSQATRVEVHDGLRAGALRGYARLPEAEEAPRGDRKWAHCDVLVVGAGPAGIAAATAAARAGARVLLACDGPHPGGGLVGAPHPVDGPSAHEWLEPRIAALGDVPELRLLTRTTVTGLHDHGEAVALQRRPHAAPGGAAHRLWHIRARRVVLATGACERPIAFEGNDRPGVMLAGAAVGYVRRHGVLAGGRAVVFGCHDEALWAAVELHDAGIALTAVADARPAPGPAPVAALYERGVGVLTASGVTRTTAGTGGNLNGATIAPIDVHGNATGEGRSFPCDLLAVSGGHDPATALAAQIGGRRRWSPEHAAFLPAELPPGTRCAGAVTGARPPAAARDQGTEAGHAAAADALSAAAGPAGSGSSEAAGSAPPTAEGTNRTPPAALWTVTDTRTDESRVFVDLQRDATLADIREAVEAGMASIEHIKRHTTIGTGPDQGRTSGVLTTGIVAGLLGRSMDGVGGTGARPPWLPIPLTAVAGRDIGELLDPARRTPMHEWHVARGAVFEDVGQWKRPRYFPREGEDMRAAVLRECRAAREGAAVLDASTLGKIMVEGRDAGVFLDRIYTNNFSTLRPGRCRYGVMCTADGMVLDDGVGVRLSESRYLSTTTTGNADTVRAWMEEWSQTEWPDLCVHITDVTDNWATISVVGPRSRDVVARLAPGLDLSPEDFEFMTFRDTLVAGVPARILRVSFTGELTFEINVPAWYGSSLWEAALAAGRPYGITPYGTESMHLLRAEKGFIVVGHETDGSVTPVDVGLGWAVSKRKDFIGKRSLWRPDTAREDREQLVGLLPEDGDHVLAEGAQLVAAPPGTPPVPMQGHVTSSYLSAVLGRSFALGLLREGRHRHGERVYAVHLDRAVPVTVTDPVFYDKEGRRRDG
ncbi:2Fe-2S iron-sulfur cluster-binding protein [Allosalinactinospora lopnorensis]|uniref:2Fe-2S iron-sulfur cluster-binding protein n=1 Tax=Allosalinactinospora lopnorensis TaxID=1352348 RepID=UPI000623E643|nr:2Fe-2S iron-sulfur cluster-binding protein [Allosalinactinospora lopnorensis]